MAHSTDSIGKTIEETSSVAASVEQQNAATNEISQSISFASKEMQQASEVVVHVTNAASSMLESVRTLLGSADALRDNSGVLRQRVDSFASEIRAG